MGTRNDRAQAEAVSSVASADTNPTAKATRRRGEQLDRAIAKATYAELQEKGYDEVTFDGVAKRAGTSRSVLHRRYRSRAHMVAEAMIPRMPSPTRRIDTGSLREDLRQFVEQFAVIHRAIGTDMVRKLTAEADDRLIDEISGLRPKVSVAPLLQILELARQRGELGSAEIPELALHLPLSAIRNQSRTSELSSGFLDELVDDVLIPLYVAHSNENEGLP